MNNSFNDFMDDIRDPDPIVKERLIDDDRTDFEKEIDEAIYLSMQDLREIEDLNNKYEEKIIKEHSDETFRREELFKNLLFTLNKLKKFDKEIKSISDILEPIIESYCNQYFDICYLDDKIYNHIFSVLSKIRTEQSAIDALKNIIIIDQ